MTKTRWMITLLSADSSVVKWIIIICPHYIYHITKRHLLHLDVRLQIQWWRILSPTAPSQNLMSLFTGQNNISVNVSVLPVRVYLEQQQVVNGFSVVVCSAAHYSRGSLLSRHLNIMPEFRYDNDLNLITEEVSKTKNQTHQLIIQPRGASIVQSDVFTL